MTFHLSSSSPLFARNVIDERNSRPLKMDKRMRVTIFGIYLGKSPESIPLQLWIDPVEWRNGFLVHRSTWWLLHKLKLIWREIRTLSPFCSSFTLSSLTIRCCWMHCTLLLFRNTSTNHHNVLQIVSPQSPYTQLSTLCPITMLKCGH